MIISYEKYTIAKFSVVNFYKKIIIVVNMHVRHNQVGLL